MCLISVHEARDKYFSFFLSKYGDGVVKHHHIGLLLNPSYICKRDQYLCLLPEYRLIIEVGVKAQPLVGHIEAALNQDLH